ncbi:MAG: CaiB/BaiF CoA transferase family protein [Bacteroidota bacterium]|jgi:crotonobetainyl-CoA:carnitine CoA-transferase CaiB-like acyl-CoA transferase
MLSHIKVIDASTVLAGPSVGTFFAELGAQVIKVENPLVPDVTRSWKLPVEDSNSTVSAYFSSINYKKEYLQIDLRTEDGRSSFLALTSDADILISNFKSGDEEKFRITDAILRKHNPKLICGKISGFGSESDRVAYDLILQAESGFMSMNGTPESGPVKMPVALIDVLAAHHLKEGLLLALLKRAAKGKGTTVTVSLYDAAVCSLVNQASNYLMTGKVPERIGSLHPNIAPYGEIFKTKDGELITFAIGSDEHFRRLCAFLGCAELTTNSKFETNPLRVINRTELFDILQNKISEINVELILGEMLKQKVPVGKIRQLDEVFTDPSARQLVRQEMIDDTKTKRVTSIAFKWE